jgi:hypothetical protein
VKVKTANAEASKGRFKLCFGDRCIVEFTWGNNPIALRVPTVKNACAAKGIPRKGSIRYQPKTPYVLMKTKTSLLLCITQFLLFAIVTSLSANAQVTLNEFWVSALPNSNPTPTGTIADPYDGSTQPKFDSVMNGISANSTIHLLGGTYYTKGEWGFSVKTGQKILGSGMDITTVVLTNTGTSTIFYNAGGGAWGTGIEISDLTCDANAQNLAPSNTYAAIWIQGPGTKIRRVKAKGLAHGTIPPTSEVFGITCTAPDGVNAEEVVVEDCVVMPPVSGSVCSSIAVWAGSNSYVSARFSGNWIYGTNTTSVDAFNLCHSYNSLVTGNHIINATWGIYSDSGGNTNLTVVDNSFRNVNLGVALLSTAHQHLYFAGNTFELAQVTNSWTAAFWGAFINEKIIGNTIKAYGTAGTSCYAFLSDSTTNVIIADNSIDNKFLWYFLGCTNATLHDNVDLFGNFISPTNQIELPNSLTRKTVSTSTYTAQYLDRYIGVQSAGSVTVTLPSPTGYQGKEFIIANERSSGNLIISASPALINGSSSISFSASYSTRTVITDGVNWFAR